MLWVAADKYLWDAQEGVFSIDSLQEVWILSWMTYFYTWNAISHNGTHTMTAKQPKTCKLQQGCWHFTTTCYKPISGNISMACDSLLMTSLLQIVNRLITSWLSKLVIQKSSCNKPDFNILVATWWNWQVYYNLLKSCSKLVKVTTCNMSVAFLVVYSCGSVM